MRNAIGGTWVLSIMIVFMMILIAYVAIQINYSKVYRLKTDVLTIIEQNDGFNAITISKIDKAIKASGYKNLGTCTLHSKNFPQLIAVNNKVPEDPKERPGKYQYCIMREMLPGTATSAGKYYYTVELYFGFELPMLGDLYTFTVNGETNTISYPRDNLFK